MAASQVVLYFEKEEDALRFTLAASSAISAEGTVRSQAGVRMAEEICKVNRITTEGMVNTAIAGDADAVQARCA